MADELLFNSEECPIEEVPKVDFPFVTDCFINPVPPPLYDAPPPEIPIDSQGIDTVGDGGDGDGDGPGPQGKTITICCLCEYDPDWDWPEPVGGCVVDPPFLIFDKEASFKLSQSGPSTAVTIGGGPLGSVFWQNLDGNAGSRPQWTASPEIGTSITVGYDDEVEGFVEFRNYNGQSAYVMAGEDATPELVFRLPHTAAPSLDSFIYVAKKQGTAHQLEFAYGGCNWAGYIYAGPYCDTLACRYMVIQKGIVTRFEVPGTVCPPATGGVVRGPGPPADPFEPCLEAIEIIFILIGDGGDFANLAEAVEAHASDLTSTGSNSILELRVRGFAGGGGDSSHVVLDRGYKTDEDHYIRIVPEEGEEHTGVFDPEKYHFDGQLDIRRGHVRIEGIQFSGSQGAGLLRAGGANSCNLDLTIKNCIITNPAGSGILLQNGGQGAKTANIFNNIIYDAPGGHFGILAQADWTAMIENNTIVDCDTGVRANNGSTVTVINNLVSGGSDAFSGSFAAGSDYNATDLGDATGGLHDRINQVFTFIDADADNFLLSPEDLGAKLYGTSHVNNDIRTDILGQTRYVPWSIGAHEQDAQGTGGGDGGGGGDGSVEIEEIIVDPDNGPGTDFLSLGAALNAHASDLVALNIIKKFICRATDGSPDPVPAAAVGYLVNGKTDSVSGNGPAYRTDAEHYIWITTAPTDQHAGVWDEDIYRLSYAGGGLMVQSVFTLIENLQVEVTANSVLAAWIGTGAYAYFHNSVPEVAATITFRNNLVRTSGGQSSVALIAQCVYEGEIYCYNNILYDAASRGNLSGYLAQISGTVSPDGNLLSIHDGDCYFENNTLVARDLHSSWHVLGIGGSTGQIVHVKNNLLYAEGDTGKALHLFTPSPATLVANYNATNLPTITSTGVNSRTSQTFSFEDESDNNFLLDVSDSGARTFGTNAVTASFTEDILGADRTVNWSIGAHEQDEIYTEEIIIDTDGGGDFTSLAAAVAAHAGDLTTLNTIKKFVVQASAGTADTSDVIVEDYVTDDDSYVWITVADTDQHAGEWDPSIYRLTASLSLHVRNVLVDGLQVSDNLLGISMAASLFSNSRQTVRGCLIENTGGFGIAGTVGAGSRSTLYNNIIYASGLSGLCVSMHRPVGQPAGSGEAILENNTLYSEGTASVASFIATTLGTGPVGTVTLRNNILYRADNTFDLVGASTVPNLTDEYNATNLASFGTGLSGDNGRTTQTFTFVDEPGGNFLLDVGDGGAQNFGTNVVDSGFTDDILGTDRDAVWSIGAHEPS